MCSLPVANSSDSPFDFDLANLSVLDCDSGLKTTPRPEVTDPCTGERNQEETSIH